MEKQTETKNNNSLKDQITIKESKPDDDNNVTVTISKGLEIQATVILERFTEDEIDFIKEIKRERIKRILESEEEEF